ncbi:hypothetical protein [Kitasatospora acidiphila]|uniref:hypothetical protein n=1 Tax=Kitasatospora acidiphila TaxID=2567942 RepID=UPI001E5ECE8A|nr:hypothetical protein [Kitasatospora acidiphila]
MPADRLLPGHPLPQTETAARAPTLTAEEREAVLTLMNDPEYAELPPAQIWARELDTG